MFILFCQSLCFNELVIESRSAIVREVACLHWVHFELFLQVIMSYICMPFAYIMGVEWKDTFEVGKLLGIKTFLNEFVAYQDLAKLIKNRENGLAGSKISVSTL